MMIKVSFKIDAKWIKKVIDFFGFYNADHAVQKGLSILEFIRHERKSGRTCEVYSINPEDSSDIKRLDV